MENYSDNAILMAVFTTNIKIILIYNIKKLISERIQMRIYNPRGIWKRVKSLKKKKVINYLCNSWRRFLVWTESDVTFAM